MPDLPAPDAPVAPPAEPLPLRVLLVDDDTGARERARAALAPLPGVTIVGECGDGATAVALIRAARPDVVVLDVQMPAMDGFEVVQALGAAMPPVIFASGYAEFAVRAFEACALDYVLKPFDEARLHRAFDRVRRDVALRRGMPLPDDGATVAPAADTGSGGANGSAVPPDAPAGLAGSVLADPRLQALLDLLARPARPRYPDALAIRAGAQYAVVRVAEVDWIEADGNYARVWVQGRPRVVMKSLTTLERDVLDPERFVRVHRSTIVNVSRVAAVEPGPHSDTILVLHDGTRVTCSRRYRDKLEERLYFTT